MCFKTLNNTYENLILLIVLVFLMLRGDCYCNGKEKEIKYHLQGGLCTTTLNLPYSHGCQSTVFLGKNELQGKYVRIEFLLLTVSVN